MRSQVLKIISEKYHEGFQSAGRSVDHKLSSFDCIIFSSSTSTPGFHVCFLFQNKMFLNLIFLSFLLQCKARDLRHVTSKRETTRKYMYKQFKGCSLVAWFKSVYILKHQETRRRIYREQHFWTSIIQDHPKTICLIVSVKLTSW